MTEGTSDVRHQLWLIYSQLKDAESDQAKEFELLKRSREDLGRLLNELNKPEESYLASSVNKPKSTCFQAADLNCRSRALNHPKSYPDINY